jgi:hypothetical protein
MVDLTVVEADDPFYRCRLSERLAFLQKLVRDNFTNPERYTGSNREAFDTFKDMSDKDRKAVQDVLVAKLIV